MKQFYFHFDNEYSKHTQSDRFISNTFSKCLYSADQWLY